MSGEGATGKYDGFRRPLTADTFSVFGDQLLSVALPLYLFDITGSAAAAAAAALARAVPVALLGVAGGMLADRHDTRRVLVVATAIRTLCVPPLLLPVASGVRRPADALVWIGVVHEGVVPMTRARTAAAVRAGINNLMRLRVARRSLPWAYP